MRSWECYFSVCNRWHKNNTRDTTKIVRHRNIRIIVVPVRHNKPINHGQKTIFTHRCRAGSVWHLLRLHSGDDVTIDCAVHYGPWNFDSNMWWNRPQIIATGHPWQLVAIGSGDGFLSSVNKPSFDSTLTKLYDATRRHQCSLGYVLWITANAISKI